VIDEMVSRTSEPLRSHWAATPHSVEAKILVRSNAQTDTQKFYTRMFSIRSNQTPKNSQ